MNAAENASEISEFVSQLIKNPVIPKSPKRISLKGKGGMVIYIDPRRVKLLPKNPRSKMNPGFSSESIEELGENIQIAGQIKAGEISLSDDPSFDAQLVDGERRLRACVLKGLMFRAEVREERLNPKQAYFRAVLANLEGVPHTCLEKADAIKALKEEHGMTVREIAAVQNMSEMWVYQYLNVFKLDPEVQQLLVTPIADVDVDEDVPLARKRRRDAFALSFSLVNDLCSYSYEEQRQYAAMITRKSMPLPRARRFLQAQRKDNGEGLARKSGKSRRSEFVASLERTAISCIDRLGFFQDLESEEFVALLRQSSPQDLERIHREFSALVISAISMRDLAKKAIGRR